MNRHHQDILKEIKKANPSREIPVRVLGTSHFCYSLTNPQKRKIVGDWWKNHRNISIKEFVSLLDSLYQGKSYDEKTLAGMLLETSRFQTEIKPEKIGEWLNFLQGWAEVDTTCQSSFEAADVLTRWSEWKKLIRDLVKDKNINKRRASLVLLGKPVRSAGDKRLAELAFRNIDLLKDEKEVLITKAISWLLRSLIKYHKKEVADYLKKNQGKLPKIAVRETQMKFAFGRKTKRP